MTDPDDFWIYNGVELVSKKDRAMWLGTHISDFYGYAPALVKPDGDIYPFIEPDDLQPRERWHLALKQMPELRVGEAADLGRRMIDYADSYEYRELVAKVAEVLPVVRREIRDSVIRLKAELQAKEQAKVELFEKMEVTKEPFIEAGEWAVQRRFLPATRQEWEGAIRELQKDRAQTIRVNAPYPAGILLVEGKPIRAGNMVNSDSVVVTLQTAVPFKPEDWDTDTWSVLVAKVKP